MFNQYFIYGLTPSYIESRRSFVRHATFHKEQHSFSILHRENAHPRMEVCATTLLGVNRAART